MSAVQNFNHRGTENTELIVRIFLCALCVSVVWKFMTSNQTIPNGMNSGIKQDLDLGAGRVTFKSRRHDYETVRSGCRGQDRCSAQGDWFDLPVGDSDAAVIHAADLRNDFRAECSRRRTVRPVRIKTAQSADGSSGKKLVGTKAGHRIAGQQENQR